MRGMRCLVAMAAAVGLAAGTIPAVNAAPPDDLQYSYDLNTPILGMPSAFASQGSCTQTLGPTFDLLMDGQPEPQLTPALAKPGNNVRCTMRSSANSPGTTIAGTVSASSGDQSGSGTFTLVCDIGRSMDSWFNVVVASDGKPALATDPYGVNGAGHVSCSWTIDIADVAKSQLSGTLEMAGAFSLDSTPVDWSNCAALGLPIPDRVLPRAKCVSFDMVISAYLTGGTGAFAGRSGEGSMTQTLFIPVVIPIDLSTPQPPPNPGCPPDNPDCTPLDLTACEYSPTDPGDPTWNDLSGLPANAQIPGFRGPGWYRCPGDGGGGGGGGDGLTGCLFSPTDPGDPTWSFIDPPAGVPGSQGPGWYRCGDAPPPPGPTVISPDAVHVALQAVLTPRSVGDVLSLSTQSGKVSAPRIVAPARVEGTSVRPFAVASKTAVRLSTVPGATCKVTAKAGKASTTLTAKAKAGRGQLDTRVTASTLMAKLKVTKGSQAVITAACSVKVGKKNRKLPPTSVTVRFT
jgi:hypothetical protein